MSSASKKRIIIHVGLPKTGSTFLQENVFSSLSGEVCAYNPETLRRMLVEMCKQVIVQGELSSHEINNLKHKVGSEIDRIEANTLLISIEGFLPIHCGGFARADNILKVLKQLINNAVIVIFIREQSAWIRSAYSFCLVSKYILSFDDYVNKKPEGGFADRSADVLGVCVYDYEHQNIKGLAQKYFSDVFCFSFEDLFSQQTLVLSKLAEILGVTQLSAKASQKVNSGLDERLMVIVSKVVAQVPFRSQWKPEYLYVRYANLSLWGKVKYAYLKKTGLLCMVIARALYKYTSYASGEKLFSALDETTIKNHYLETNARFWVTSP